MTAEAASRPCLTIPEYLEGEQVSEVRHEYYDGAVRAMAGATVWHNAAAGFLYRALAAALRGGPCKVFMSDVKVHLRIRREQPKDLFYYPDVMVACDPDDRHPLFRQHPKLIIEVLSADESRDLVEKYFTYQQIESLEEYVVVRPEPDHFEVLRFLRRDAWDGALRATSGVFGFHSVPCQVDLDELVRELREL